MDWLDVQAVTEDAASRKEDTDLLADLNEPQADACIHESGPLLILAGPGSGKTRVVTHRIAHLLQEDIAAREILALTFTNKAAEEMRGRLDELVPREPVWMGTFHRFCSRLLREYASFTGLDENFTIYDTNDSQKVLQRVMEESEFDSQRVNSELKHLGYPVSNITRAFDRLRPTFVQQTKKTGATRQARKRYRLTHEGRKRVEEMLAR